MISNKQKRASENLPEAFLMLKIINQLLNSKASSLNILPCLGVFTQTIVKPTETSQKLEGENTFNME